MTVRMPAEWEPQDGVLLAWPHEESDWHPYLDRVEPVFRDIALHISRFERVIIVGPDPESIRTQLASAGARMERVSIYPIPTNDTWSRDFGPITILKHEKPLLLDFGFNGWGLKFAANLDNQVNRELAKSGAFGTIPMQVPGLIMEGGSLESDGKGTLLTTSECLLNPNRNPHLSREQIEKALTALLGFDRYLWLNNGYLAGDDTDSHIDTLARLCPEDTIVYVTCDDPKDEHFEALQSMERELKEFRTREGNPYRLIPLPWPGAVYDEEGQRLPATYANFLIINDAVLVPTYGDVQDEAALSAIARAFPGREVIGIDCVPLILQHGSLHCVTMQLPKGVLP